MLLTEWLTELGLLPDARRSALALDSIRQFQFGENYAAVLYSGVDYEDRDLDRMLGMMCDEFNAWNSDASLAAMPQPRHAMSVEIGTVVTSFGARPSYSDPLAQRGAWALYVRPVAWVEPTPPPPIERVAEVVREAVTFYSLSGTWDIEGIRRKIFSPTEENSHGQDNVSG